MPSRIVFDAPPLWTLPPSLVLGAEARRALAEGYAAVGDERAVAYYEEFLSEIKKQGPLVGEAFELTSLAELYQALKDYRKAADTYARAEQYSTQPFFLGHSMIKAAEMYRSVGDDKKADEFYERATQVGNGYDAGRALLLQAYFHYSAGSLDQARKYSQQALNMFQAIKEPHLIVASRDFIEQAQTLLTYSETWGKEPILAKPREVRVKADEDVNFSDSLFARFRVRTVRDVPLTVTCDNPKVKIRIESDDVLNSARFKYFVEKQVIIEIPLTEAQKGLHAVIRVSSPNLQGQVQVPLHVEP